MDPIDEQEVNVYLPDSYLKGVISFSETNALGSCIIGRPFLKDDFTATTSIRNPLIEHKRIRDTKLVKNIISNPQYRLVEPLQMQHELLSVLSPNFILHTANLRKIIQRSVDITDKKLNPVLHILNLNSPNHEGKVSERLTRLIKKHLSHIPNWVSSWYNIWVNLNNLLQEYRSKEVIDHNCVLTRQLSGSFIHVVISQYGVVIISKKSKRYTVCTYNQFLTWKDLALSRFNANYVVWLSNVLNTLNEGLGLRCRLKGHLLSKLYISTDIFLSSTSNEFYNVVKEFEGFIMSLILKRTEEALFSIRFYNNMLNNLIDAIDKARLEYLTRCANSAARINLPSTDVMIASLGDILSLINVLGESNLNNLSELYFIFRIFGHPMVDERKAMDAVRDNCCETKFLMAKNLASLRGAYVYRIIKGFVANYNRWPYIKTRVCLTPTWINYLDTNSCPSLLEMTKDDFIVLAGVHFIREFHIPKLTDLEIILNDKAISPPKSLIWSCFPKNYIPQVIQDEYARRYCRAKAPLKTRRVLEFYLQDKDFKLDQLHRVVVNQDYLNDKEHIISLTGKERELSVGRMFAMQPGKQRQVQILAEKLLADNILQFFPETLTRYGDLELQKILELKAGLSNKNDRSKDSYNNYISRCSLITDLSKFNQAFRYESSCVCSDLLDELHGTQSLFSWLHLTVPLTTIMCTYRHAPPDTGNNYNVDDIAEQSGLYRYHMGGIEGWCQKLWTTEAIALLDTVAVKGRFQLTSLINGDNQSIDISKPTRLGTRTQSEADYDLAINSLRLISAAYRGIGHKLKEGETYLSRDMQFMSKTIQHEGVYYPASIKKILRVGPWINTILDDIKTSTESIGSLTQELEYKGESLMSSLLLRNFWLYRLYSVDLKDHSLCGKQLYRSLIKVLKHLKRCFNLENLGECLELFLNVPMQFGGADPNVLYRSFYRRTPDFLTETITHLILILKHFRRDLEFNKDNVSKAVLSLLEFTKNDSAEFVTLMRDPQAIGSERQAKITSDINRTAVTNVLSNAPNEIFRTSALHYSSTENELNSIASDISPVYPHGLRVLYESLPFHKAEKIVNMVSGTKSITNILEKTSAISYTDIIRATNMMVENLTLLTRIMKPGADTSLDPDTIVITILSKIIRDKSWDVGDIIGVTSPSPVSCFKVVYTSTLQNNSVVIERYTTDTYTRGKRGPTKPWVGSSTQEKKSMPVYNRQVLTRGQRDQIENIAKLEWVFSSVANIDSLLNELSTMTLGLSLRKCKQLFPTYLSLNFLHRLSVSSRPREYPSSLPAYRTTNFHFDTGPINKVLTERFGDEDINLVFQNAISYGLSTMSLVEQFTGVCPNKVLLVPKLQEIQLMKVPIFQGGFNLQSIIPIIRQQHMFLPNHITPAQYIELFLSSKQFHTRINLNHNNRFKLVLQKDYFNGENMIETLSTCLAGHWIIILMLMKESQGIFDKEWYDGFVTDHMFLDLQLFLSSFKTFLTVFNFAYLRVGSNIEEITGNQANLLELLDLGYWKNMYKVFSETKVRLALLKQDLSFNSVKNSSSFRHWFINSLQEVQCTSVPWVVNVTRNPTHLKGVLQYMKMIESGMIQGYSTNISSVLSIPYNYPDMAHMMTKIIRNKGHMSYDYPKIKKSLTFSMTDMSDSYMLNLFPKVVCSYMSGYLDKLDDTLQLLKKPPVGRKVPSVALPWHHCNRYNFVFSSTGCKVSVIDMLPKHFQRSNLKVMCFIGEGAGNLMLRAVLEVGGNIKLIYRSLKDPDDHHVPVEFLRLKPCYPYIDTGGSLSLASTDATNKAHWDYLHLHWTDPLNLIVCDAEISGVKHWLKILHRWYEHMTSCKHCLKSEHDKYLIIKYHAQDDLIDLPHGVRLLKCNICLGSKLSGSESYLLIGLGLSNKLPVYSEVLHSKLLLAECHQFHHPKYLDVSGINTNIKSLIPMLDYPITYNKITTLLESVRELSSNKNKNTMWIGRNPVYHNKWLKRKYFNILKWLKYCIELPAFRMDYNSFERIEMLYPNLRDLVDSVSTSELKKVVKVTGILFRSNTM
ncbi:polymerase protein [Pneumovirus dog/Bari/100-12/ITA/2012]|uniref:Replicase n=1 Tax=Pneumovirus dog/Bari/100-12/ITA/2012 TaxID=2482952 RepID=W0IWY5_9MONO|nr:polymerase protein [Pneumovirus dog/Bari/100-12/ITA/2012]AHF88964.1 RNA-dependent RNA polymerase [Pneumovirus dog/Bari/100-12/ITA/2012]